MALSIVYHKLILWPSLLGKTCKARQARQDKRQQHNFSNDSYFCYKRFLWTGTSADLRQIFGIQVRLCFSRHQGFVDVACCLWCACVCGSPKLLSPYWFPKTPVTILVPQNSCHQDFRLSSKLIEYTVTLDFVIRGPRTPPMDSNALV